MNEKDELTKKFIMINMNEIGISNEEKPIIGTQGLSSCIGFILYNKEHKKAIVGHVSCDKIMSNAGLEDICLDIYGIVCENELLNSSFDLQIIEGAYRSQYEIYSHELEILKESYKTKYNLLEVLEENIKRIGFIKIDSVNMVNFPANAFQIVDEYGNCIYNQGATLSKQFAYDASSGEFVTDKVLFGEQYSKISSDYTV